MTINCKGNLIDLTTPKVMGILNLTPDSFYSGSRNEPDQHFLKNAEKMLKEGATFIDIGGYSTRPGGAEVTSEEEMRRVFPAVELLLQNFPEGFISVDTFRSEVANKCLEAGATMINDISAANLDESMMEVVAKHQVPYIMMHMRGNPQTMSTLNEYDDMIREILYYFSERVKMARDHGINDIIIDPGFGFSKNIDQNFDILDKLELFKILELPILAGLSRKSIIYKTLKCEPGEALNGSTVLNTIALLNGASILRVHDVREAMEVVKLTGNLKN